MNWIKSNWALVLAALVALVTGTGYFMRKTLYRIVWQPLRFKLDSLINYIHATRLGLDGE